MKESGVLSKTALVYGQMNEPPGARMRVALSGLTMAEYFRDREGQDVLLFIDNIFRFTQAGSEVSALLGRMPSAVGYQPTLATEMGALQERITSTKHGRPDRPGSGDDLRASGCDDGSFPCHFFAGHLSGGRSAGIHQPHFESGRRGRGALPRGARCSAHLAAL